MTDFLGACFRFDRANNGSSDLCNNRVQKAPNKKCRVEREKMQLAKAIKEGLKPEEACKTGPEEVIELPNNGWCGGVLLVTNGEQHDLIGIVTAFDLL